MNTKVCALVLAIVIMLIPACTDSEPATPPSAKGTTTTVLEGVEVLTDRTPPPPVASGLAGENLLVALEARWMCDVQRFAYPNLNAMNDALAEHLGKHGVAHADYDAFKTDLENRIDLREQVLAAYDDYCGDD